MRSAQMQVQIRAAEIPIHHGECATSREKDDTNGMSFYEQKTSDAESYRSDRVGLQYLRRLASSSPRNPRTPPHRRQ